MANIRSNYLHKTTTSIVKTKPYRVVIEDLNVKVVETDLVKITKGYVKHDAEHLAQVLMTTILDKKLLYDKKKIIEYMYLSKKIGNKK